MLELKLVKINKPQDVNVILGQSHFIKTVEDLYEVLVNNVPDIKFGIGFAESSGACKIRCEGNDPELKELAAGNALTIASGHSFIIFIPNFALEICLGLPRRARLNPIGFNLSALRADFAIAKSGFMRNAYPINVLNAVKNVPEVCNIYCATANPVEVIIAESETGRGILGVIDGLKPTGIESDADITWRKDLLRKIGYKLK